MAETVSQWETAQDGLDKVHLKEDVPMPEPGENEVLVRIRAVSLNYRDTEVAMGLYTHHKTFSSSNPAVVICSDMCGTIEKLGPGAEKTWQQGDRVLSIFNQGHLTGQVKPYHMTSGLGLPLPGVLATYRVFPVTGLVKAPTYMSDEEASTLPIATVTAWMALNGMKKLEPGEKVLVQGTGGVSIAGLQIAAAAGAEVFVTSSSDAKLERAKALGGAHLINYKKHPDWDKQIMETTNNEGVDLIFENGGAQTLRKSFESIAFGGLINCIGYLSGKQDDPGDRTNVNVLALSRNVTLKGILNGPRDRFEEAARFYEEKKIHPVVDRVFGFGEAKEAFKYLYAGGHFGKVVVRVQD